MVTLCQLVTIYVPLSNPKYLVKKPSCDACRKICETRLDHSHEHFFEDKKHQVYGNKDEIRHFPIFPIKYINDQHLNCYKY